ncbi:MAG TPA: hypothetical protein VL961_09270 [Acidimicrobiales bacterium]|nr:hypothetical protein [Acidimicrobiales bacterium]
MHAGHSSLHGQRAFDEAWASAVELPSEDLLQMLRRKVALKHCGPAALGFEREEIERRLAVWDVLEVHLTGGADSWTDVEAVLTEEDLEKLEGICGGRNIHDVMAQWPMDPDDADAG